jgi:nicotinamide riboside transporter PnuC
MWIEIVGIVSGLLAIVGVILNNRRLRACFVLWWVSNASSLIIHLSLGCYSLAIRDFVFFVLAIEGWIRWGK